jgi:hypothetical protein
MNVSWRFPIRGRYTAGLRLEAINVTDEQEIWGIAGLPTTGQPSLTSANFQRPRRLRAVVAFRF